MIFPTRPLCWSATVPRKTRISSAPTYQHADELRRRKIFGQVIESFWKLEPGSRRGYAWRLRAAGVHRAALYQRGLFHGAGDSPRTRLCQNDQPDFPRVQKRGSQMLHYCGPVGTHDSMTGVILGRAREVVEKFPFPRLPRPKETTLFIAGHGTGNNENSRKAIERQVELIRAQALYAEVHPLFMEEEPRIGDCYAMAATRNLVVVPFFISDGLHSNEDIPVMLGRPGPPWRSV